jgi:hypothetical protein
MSPGEPSALAGRLRARADGAPMRNQPEQRHDLQAAASLIDQLADLTTEILSSAAVIDRLASLLRIAGGALMPAHVNLNSKFTVTIFRDGDVLDTRTAATGERALKTAILMLAELDELQGGDRLAVTEA